MNTHGARLDLVLVNPGGQAAIYQSLSATLTAHEPPVWAGLLAGFARRHGLSCAIVDAGVDRLSFDQTADRVAELDPVLVAVVVYGHQPSASTQHMPAAGGICRAIKRRHPHLQTLMVGGHVAALPQRTLEEEAVDFTCGGEGPRTIAGLVAALRDSAPHFDAVPDLWFRQDGDVRSTRPAPLLLDLDDEMPGIAWDLLPMAQYRAHNWHCFGQVPRQPYAALYTTLGCPYHCSFCCIQAPFKRGEQAAGRPATVNSYRFWSPQAVVAQIDTLVHTYGVRNLKIADEMFVLNPRHVLAICDALIARDYDLNIWAYARVDTLQERMIDKLRRAGFRWLAFGIEASDAGVRADVDKGFEQDAIFAAMERVRAAGIHVIGNYIFGLPEDTYTTMQATLDLALDLNCEFANFYCTMAYPGSPLYQRALAAGWPLPETWSGYSQHAYDALPLPTRMVPAPEVLAFRDRAFQVYFNSPRYLDMIAQRFGPETVREVRDMSAHSLARKYVPAAPQPAPQ